MAERIDYRNTLNYPDERIVIAKDIIVESVTKVPQIQYGAGFGSFWTGGWNPFDIDLIMVVADRTEFGRNKLKEISQPLTCGFGLPVDIQLADKWEVVIGQNVVNLKAMMRKGYDLYGTRPNWLR